MTFTFQTYLPLSLKEVQQTHLDEVIHSVPSCNPEFSCMTITFQTYLPPSIEEVQQTCLDNIIHSTPSRNLVQFV